MYNIASLQTGLAGLIGVRAANPTIAEIPSMDTAITASSSGQYWDDFHPLLSTDLLYFCSPNFEAENYSAWSAVVTYPANARVIHNDIAWQSKAALNINHVPPDPAWWKTLYSVWLQERINSSIGNLFHKVAVNKKLNLSTKSLLEDIQLFIGAGRISDQITKAGRLVGLKIRPKMINNIAVALKYVGVQFSVADSFNLYLWHSSREDAVATIAVTTTTNNKFEWKALTSSFVLDYVNFANNIDAGGDWYLGYFEDEIAGFAINKAYDFDEPPCSGCPGTGEDLRRYNLWNKYVDIVPFAFSAADLNGIKLPDIEKTGYTYSTNYGLNLSLNVAPDLTALVLQNTSMLVYPLGMQFAHDIIEWMVFNPPRRVNAPQINANKGAADYALNSETGIKVELKRATDALSEDLSKISTVLSDNRPSRVRYGSI